MCRLSSRVEVLCWKHFSGDWDKVQTFGWQTKNFNVWKYVTVLKPEDEQAPEKTLPKPRKNSLMQIWHLKYEGKWLHTTKSKLSDRPQTSSASQILRCQAIKNIFIRTVKIYLPTVLLLYIFRHGLEFSTSRESVTWKGKKSLHLLEHLEFIITEKSSLFHYRGGWMSFTDPM